MDAKNIERVLIALLLCVLAVYIVAAQFYVSSGLNGTDTEVTIDQLRGLQALIVSINVIYMVSVYRTIQADKALWLIYMFFTSGLGSIHYHFYRKRRAKKNT